MNRLTTPDYSSHAPEQFILSNGALSRELARRSNQKRDNMRILMMEQMGYTPEGYALKMRADEARLKIGGLFQVTKKKKQES